MATLIIPSLHRGRGLTKNKMEYANALICSRHISSRTNKVWSEHCSSFNPFTGWFCTFEPGAGEVVCYAHIASILGIWALNGINQQQNNRSHMSYDMESLTDTAAEVWKSIKDSSDNSAMEKQIHVYSEQF